MNALYYLFSFTVSVLGMLLILKSRGFYPFKDTTLFAMDLKSQYMPFYASLRYVFGGDNSIFFSWAKALGGNYIGLYAYYLANPLSWLTILFPLEKFHAAILLLVLLKTGLSGLTFSIFAAFLWKRYFSDAKNLWHRFLLVPFAVSYALISYNILFSINPMWLDGVIMLPLILLGVEKILNGKRGGWYVAAFAAACLFNYYTAYMTGLFAAIYFIFRVITLCSHTSWKKYGAAALRFTAATLLAAGLAAPLLIPTILDLFSGKFTMERSFPEMYTNFPLLSLFKQFRNGTYTGMLPIHDHINMPNIYCGYIALALALAFFLLRKISVRERLAAGGVLLVLICSFYFVPINLLWHGLTEPNGYAYRYSFVMSFFILYLAVRTLCILPLEKLPSIWQRKPVFECITLLIAGIVALDMGWNGRALLDSLTNEFSFDEKDLYTEYLDSTQPLIEEIQEKDSGLYRINQGYDYSRNDPMLSGYNGMSHYSSTFNMAVTRLASRLGMGQDIIFHTGDGFTPLTDSLLGAKYILDDRKVPDFYTQMTETEYETASYRNENALAIVYGAPFPEENITLTEDSPFQNQNILLNGIAGTETEYFTPVEYTQEGDENGWSYIIEADSQNPLYLYMHFNGYSLADVYVNGESAGQYFTSETKYILYLGSFEPGQKVVVEIVPVSAIHVEKTEIYQMQETLLRDTLEMLQTGNMQINSHGAGKLEGTIYVPEGGKIVTSIPYDSGWTIKLDGRKVPAEIYADTFIMVEADSGTHSISFSYVSPGVFTGLVIFGAAALLSILYFHKAH